MLVKVRDRKTGTERTVTQKAYAAMGPKVYEKLGFVNDDGTEIAGSPNSKAPQVQQVSRSVRSAGPVVVKTQLVEPAAQLPEPENEATAEDQQDQPAAKVKGKPGPKPGSKKSISSNSDENEQ